MTQENAASGHRSSGRRPRGSLSREAILDAAFALSEELSVDGMSMPRLARSLDVGVTSLYWYFRSKEELLEAMSMRAAEFYLEQLPDRTGLPWDEHIRAYFHDMLRLFRDNPVVCDILVFRRNAGGSSTGDLQRRVTFMARLDRELQVLIDAGFDPATAAHAYQAMSVYTQGVVYRQRLFALSEHGETFGIGDERQAGDQMWAFDGAGSIERYPALAASRDEWSSSFASDRDFDVGLELLISGLRTRLEAES